MGFFFDSFCVICTARVVKLQPTGQMLRVFINKVLGAQPCCSFTYRLCFHMTTAGVGSCDRDRMACKP